jgi:hypothetical protein
VTNVRANPSDNPETATKPIYPAQLKKATIPSGIQLESTEVKDTIDLDMDEALNEYEKEVDGFMKISSYLHDIGDERLDKGLTIVFHGKGAFTFNL